MDETANLFDLLYVYTPEEFAAFESWGGWDFPIQDFNLFDPGAFGGEVFDANAMQWIDTTTGEVVTPDQAQALDVAAWNASYEREFGTPPPELAVPPSGIDPILRALLNDPRLEGKAVLVDANGTRTIVNLDGSPLSASDKGFFDSTWGRALLTLGLGAAGVGIAQALTPSRDLRVPSIPQNPVQTAGQRLLMDTLFGGGGGAARDPAEEARVLEAARNWNGTFGQDQLTADAYLAQRGLISAPGAPSSAQALRSAIASSLGGQAESAEALREQAARARVAGTQLAPIQDLIRQLGIAQIPEQVATPEPFDLVGSGIRARVIKALLGEEVDPTLEADLGRKKEVLLNQLAKMYGRPGQEAEGTVGGALVQGFDTEANKLRYAVNRDILQLLAPQEQARTAYQAGRRDTRLGQNVAMSGYGLVPPAQTAETLGRMMPIQPLLGIGDTTGEKNAQLAAQYALAGFQAQTSADRAQADAIARIFGTAAGTLTTPTYNFNMANPSAWSLAA